MHSDEQIPRQLNSVLILLNSALIFVLFLVSGIASNAGPFVALYLRVLGGGNLALSLVPLIWSASALPSFIGSYYVEKLKNNKRVTLIGLTCISVGAAAVGSLAAAIGGAGGMVMLIVGLYGCNLISNVYQFAFYAWCPELIGERAIGRLQSLMLVVQQAAAIAVLPLAGRWLDIHQGPPGFAVLFVMAGAAGLLSVVPLAFARGASVVAPVREAFWDGTRQMMADRNFRRLLWLVFLVNLAPLFTGAYTSIFIKETLQVSYQTAGTILMLPWAAALATSLAWGRAADRFGGRLVALFGIAGAILQPLLNSLAAPGHTLPVYLGQLVGGGLYVAYSVAWPKLMYDLSPPHKRATAMALLWVACSLGGLVAPFLGGLLIQRLGAFHFAFGARVYHPTNILLLVQALLTLPCIYFGLAIRVPGQTSGRQAVRWVLRHPFRTVWLAIYGDHIERWLR
jgi:MFS family permease